jgi:hypothetical protein
MRLGPQELTGKLCVELGASPGGWFVFFVGPRTPSYLLFFLGHMYYLKMVVICIQLIGLH